MPSRWEVALPGLDASAVRLEHLHAVVSGWFDKDDAAHWAEAKPYTVCPPRAADGAMVIEVGLLDEQLRERLRAAASPGTSVRLGSTWSQITRPPQLVAELDWNRLTADPRVRSWCLRFITPTTFRRGNAFTPAPSLRAILGSLRRSWQLTPSAPPLVLDLSPEPVWLTDIEVTSHVVPVAGRTVSGFTGRLRFTCDGGPGPAAAIDRLVQLAPYAGVGAYTTRGFGVTRPEPTWPHAHTPGQHRPQVVPR